MRLASMTSWKTLLVSRALFLSCLCTFGLKLSAPSHQHTAPSKMAQHLLLKRGFPWPNRATFMIPLRGGSDQEEDTAGSDQEEDIAGSDAMPSDGEPRGVVHSRCVSCIRLLVCLPVCSDQCQHVCVEQRQNWLKLRLHEFKTRQTCEILFVCAPQLPWRTPLLGNI